MPADINGIPYTTPDDRIAIYPTISEDLADWIDQNTVRSTDARLTNSRPPTPHGHAAKDVTGLSAALARLDALAYDSGWRTIAIPSQYATSGKFKVRRIGDVVWMDFDEVQCVEDPNNSFVQWFGLLPSGFRPSEPFVYLPLARRNSLYSAGPLRVSLNGDFVCYNNDGERIVAHISFVAESTRPV